MVEQKKDDRRPKESGGVPEQLQGSLPGRAAIPETRGTLKEGLEFQLPGPVPLSFRLRYSGSSKDCFELTFAAPAPGIEAQPLTLRVVSEKIHRPHLVFPLWSGSAPAPITRLQRSQDKSEKHAVVDGCVAALRMIEREQDRKIIPVLPHTKDSAEFFFTLKAALLAAPDLSALGLVRYGSNRTSPLIDAEVIPGWITGSRINLEPDDIAEIMRVLPYRFERASSNAHGLAVLYVSWKILAQDLRPVLGELSRQLEEFRAPPALKEALPILIKRVNQIDSEKVMDLTALRRLRLVYEALGALKPGFQISLESVAHAAVRHAFLIGTTHAHCALQELMFIYERAQRERQLETRPQLVDAVTTLFQDCLEGYYAVSPRGFRASVFPPETVIRANALEVRLKQILDVGT